MSLVTRLFGFDTISKLDHITIRHQVIHAFQTENFMIVMILYVSCCYYFMFSNDGRHYSLVHFFTSKSNFSLLLSSFSNEEWWLTDFVLLFVCSFMFVVFDSVVDCSHHSLPSPLLPPPGLSSLQKRPHGNGNGKSFKDFLRVTNKNHRLVCGKKCPS